MKKLKVALIVALVTIILAPILAWAANTIILNNESGVNVRTKLNNSLAQQFNIRQPPYSATGDGTTNDSGAIQSAINDACISGGGTIYFPPGQYSLSTGLNFDACDNQFNFINLKGEGQKGSFIKCALVGFCVDQHGVITATGGQHNGGLWTVDGLAITNSLVSANGIGDIAGGALRFEGSTPGQIITRCELNGGVGLVMGQLTFGGSVTHCGLGAGPGIQPGAVGIYAGQLEITDIRLLGYNVDIAVAGTAKLSQISTESSQTGIYVGMKTPNVFRGFIDDGTGSGAPSGVAGKVLTVTKYAYGPFDGDSGGGAGGHGAGIANGMTLNLGVCLTCSAASTISSQLSSSQSGGFNGAEGRYQLTATSNVIVSSQTMATDYVYNQPTGVGLSGLQTERLGSGLIVNATSSTFSNAHISGTLGPKIRTSGASWATLNSGTLTYNLLFSLGRSGLQPCFAEDFAPAAYNFNQNNGFPSGVNCRYSGTTVTIAGADNPAAPISGNIANPGTSATTPGNVSAAQDSCITLSLVDSSSFNSIGCSINAPHDLDFSGLNPQGVSRNRFSEMAIKNGISLPGHNVRGAIVVQNNTGFSEADLQKNFSDLPGAPGVVPSARIEGEEHLIIDLLAGAATCQGGFPCCNDAGNTCTTFGATVTDGTTVNNLHRRVRWNGTNWTLVGM